jgi:hypothetical protein
VGPQLSQGKRGSGRLDTTANLGTFLGGVVTKALRIFGEGSVAGQMLVASDATGIVAFSDTLPAVAYGATGLTLDETATLGVAAPGEYIATVYIECTTASAGTGVLYASLTYNDDVGVVTVYPTVGIPTSATGRDQATVTLRCVSGAIDYVFQIVGTGTPTYAGFISITKVR